MSNKHELSTREACRVVGIDPDNFNTYISAKIFPCAPETSQGKARSYDADDLLAMWLFRTFMDDRIESKRAGALACDVAKFAKANPQVPVVSVVFGTARNKSIHPYDQISQFSSWEGEHFGGIRVHDGRFFDIAYIRRLIEERIEAEIRGAK